MFTQVPMAQHKTHQHCVISLSATVSTTHSSKSLSHTSLFLQVSPSVISFSFLGGGDLGGLQANKILHFCTRCLMWASEQRSRVPLPPVYTTQSYSTQLGCNLISRCRETQRQVVTVTQMQSVTGENHIQWGKKKYLTATDSASCPTSKDVRGP